MSPSQSGVDSMVAPVKIGMWGGKNTGKTTFLSVLQDATRSCGLSLIPRNDSAKQLISTSRLAVRRGERPVTGGTRNYTEYKFDIQGSLRSNGLIGMIRDYFLFNRSLDLTSYPMRVDIHLHMIDVPGERFATDVNTIIETWFNSLDALIFLYDLSLKPSRSESPYDDNFDAVLDFVNSLAEKQPGQSLVDGRLPHYLAVCMTKFDQFSVFERFHQHRFIDPLVKEGIFSRIPRVAPENAERAFHAFGDPHVQDELGEHFLSDRTRFFVTSAFGFHQVGEGVKFSDVVEDATNQFTGQMVGESVESPAKPINIIEPLIWLHDSLSKERRRGEVRSWALRSLTTRLQVFRAIHRR